MYISHSLIPITAGRGPVRQTVTLTSGDRWQENTTASSRRNTPDGHIYEGELVAKGFSFDTISSNRAKRLFTQQSDYSRFMDGNRLSSGKPDAIEAYASNARLTGTNLSVYENILDVYA